MEVHQLRYFCAVARTGSFTRAAEQERVAQPSLSQQIHKLEDELGARLFDRLGRRIRLTLFGTTFLPRATAILRELSEAATEIRQMAGSEAGTVVFGSIPTVAPYFLPPLLAPFFERHSNIRLRVIEEITPLLLTQLQEGAMDLAVIALPATGSEFHQRELLREPLFVAVAKNHPLAHEKFLHLRHLESHPFLLLKEGHCFRETIVSACQHSRLQLNVVFETGQFSTILGLVAAGMGISVVPEMAIQAVKGCRFIPLADDRAFRRIGLVWLRNHFQTRAEMLLIDHLTKLAQQMHRRVAIPA
jgi:LysR family transcriptional regulator, hydrogen peroxide-inducible genes activator